MSTPTVEAKVRKSFGKGAMRKLRAEGYLPGVVYGRNHEATPVVVNLKDLRKALHHQNGIHTKLTLKLQKDAGEESLDVIIQEYQADPITDKPWHVDFMVLYPDVPIKRTIPIRLEGRALGVKKGGRMFTYRKEVTISCLPDNFIPELVVDISNVDIGQSLRVNDLKYPEGVTPVTKDNFSILYIKPYKADATAAAGEAEGEAGGEEAAAAPAPQE